jgi:putative membrane-bound dehydrogenase-like protein
LADSIHDDLHARCLVLDNGQTKIALVVCDSCMIPREVFDAAKQMAAEKTGILTDHILCSATHTHSAVSVAKVFQSEVEETYSRLLIQRIAEGIALAHLQREPAKIGWALGNAPQHVFNRRWFLRSGVKNDDPFDHGTDQVRMNPPSNHRDLLMPAGPTDPQVPVLAVQALDGRPIAVWANYSLHYVGGVPGNALSADYFGEFARRFEALVGGDRSKTTSNDPPLVIAMTNGTSGDVNNVNFYTGNGLQQPFEQIRLVASDVAQAAYVAYQRIDFQNWVPLVVKQTEIELTVRKQTDAELIRAKDVLTQSGNPPWNTLRAIYAHESLQLAEYPDTVKMPLQVMRLGELGIAAIPCETFVETGLALKAQSPLQPMFTIELANGYYGYLPTPQQHALGGYETWRAKSSYLGVHAEPKIVGSLLKLLDQVSSQEAGAEPAPAIDASGNAQPQLTDALSVIESTRGGRHWVDLPTAPPKSPEESQSCFQIEPGVKIELVASEPMVLDPVWVTFDHWGRMFVAEYADYPTGPADQSAPPLSRIVLLEDSDGDTVMDRRHLFAEQLNFCHSIMAFRDGLLAGTKDSIVYFKDTDGDNKADVREALFSGFHSPHPQMQVGCPQWGIDNWIYLTYGPGKVSRASDILLNSLFGAGQGVAPLETSVQSQRDIPNKDFRFCALTLDFGPTSGFGQYGNTIDAWGRRYFCTNRNPVITAPISPEQFRRNPYWIAAQDQYDVAPSGEQSVVYPAVEMRSNYLSHAGTYTAACGTTAYLGDLLGDQFASSLFVCEPIGHLITRYVVEPQGAQMVACRARENADFLTSTDSWFRPTSLASGPDGALYMADMYRLWVEHPQFLPPQVAKRLDLRAGQDRGRIWRIVPADKSRQRKAFQLNDTPQALAAMLGHPNGWHRQLAQRLLVERQVQAAAPLLREMIRSDSNSHAVHASLWTLHGLRCLTSSDVSQAMESTHARVRDAAVRLAAEHLIDQSVVQTATKLAEDPDALVRFQTALTLGQLNDHQTTSALAKIAAADHQQPWTVNAILTSAQGRSAEILAAMQNNWNRDTSPPNGETTRLARQLSECTGAEGNVEQLQILLQAIVQPNHALDWWNMTLLSGLASGLNRYQGEMGKLSLQTLLDQPPAALTKLATQIQQMVRGLPNLAFDNSAEQSDRLAAMELLGYLPSLQSEGSIEQLLDTSQPGEIQLSALRSLRKQPVEEWSRQIIQRWAALGPQVRTEAVAMQLGHKTSTLQALHAMLDGQLESAILSVDQRALLLAHPNSEIRQLAEKVIGSGASADRQAVVQQYWPAARMSGHSVSGQTVFDRVCASCHRVAGRGKSVGPDLSDSRSRSREALLVDIIDPNHRIDPQYLAYQVLTHDGQVYQGQLQAETSEAIVLMQPGGHQQTVLRTEIEQMKVGGRSLMPDGVEKDVTLEQMADLIEFLKPSK